MTEKLILSEIYQLPELENDSEQDKRNVRERIFGISNGRYSLAPDFDEPLEDFKEYM